MSISAIGAIGHGDEERKTQYSTNNAKRRPWEEIGAMINGFGSVAVNLPANFNSAFTVGKSNGETQGAFRS